jgi:hypothetical protein
MDDLEIIAVLDANLSQGRSRDDLQVALDRDAKRVKAELVDQLGDGRFARHPAMLAVDPNREAAVDTH